MRGIGGIMKAIKDNLRSIGELVRSAKEDAEAGAGRLAEAEAKVDETMAILDARKQNINLDIQPKRRAVRSKE